MISVLIVNWNTKELLRACLKSVFANPPKEELEVIVVDNASKDQSAKEVSEQFPEVKLRALDRNLGYAAGNNVAFEIATGDLLLTLNPDTEIFADTLDNAASCLRSSPEVGCVGARQIGTDGRVQLSVRGFPTAIGILGDVLKIRTGKFDSYRLSQFDYGRTQRAPQPMGTFLMFKREALDSVGSSAQPFDEQFPIFFNEVDLLYRLDRRGWTTVYCFEARILHYGGEGTKQVRKSMIWESHRSLLRFMKKHYGTGFARIGLLFLAPLVYMAAFARARGYHAGFRA